MTAPTLPGLHVPEQPTPAPASAGAGTRPRYRVVGVDVSLQSTGVAGNGWTEAIATKGKRSDSILQRHARLSGIAERTLTLAGTPHLAVIEGPSLHSVGGSTWDRGGLWWLIVDGLMARDIPVAVMPPKCRAKYATGNGDAGKTAVVEAVSRWLNTTFETDDEADAAVMRAAGLDWLGCPIAHRPDRFRAALDGCMWPDPIPAVTR